MDATGRATPMSLENPLAESGANSPRRILVALDGTASSAAVFLAAVNVAHRTKSELVLAHVLPASAPASMVHDAGARLERLAGSSRLHDVATSTVLLTGDPVEQLVSYTVGNGITLVALGSHGDWRNERGLYGSVADAIIRQSPVPVLVWRIPRKQTQAAASRLQRLLVPLDGSRLAERALPDALALARATGGHVLLLQVVSTWQPFVGSDSSELVQRELRAAGAYLASVRERFCHFGVPIDLTVRLGRPSDVIRWVTQEMEADLVVMATHGRSGSRRERVGSVALDVLQGDVPLLLHAPGALMNWDTLPPALLDVSVSRAMAS